MSATMTDIDNKLTALETAINNLIANNKTLAEDLKAAIAANDPAALQAVADRLDKDTAAAQAELAADPAPAV